MSTTLHDHPPQQREQQAATTARPSARRPSALDRLALRLGLLLITYGRRRYALSREEQQLHRERRASDEARERAWERQRLLLLPPR